MSLMQLIQTGDRTMVRMLDTAKRAHDIFDSMPRYVQLPLKGAAIVGVSIGGAYLITHVPDILEPSRASPDPMPQAMEYLRSLYLE